MLSILNLLVFNLFLVLKWKSFLLRDIVTEEKKVVLTHPFVLLFCAEAPAVFYLSKLSTGILIPKKLGPRFNN